MIDILRAAAPIAMISVGMCLVIATAGIDLSVGSLMAVAGAVSMELLASAGGSAGAALAALGLALLLGAVLGAVNAVLISVVGLQPFISTLVMMLAGRGLAKVITGGQNTAASNETFRWIANGYVLGLPVVFLLAVLIVIAVGLLVRRSALGLMIEAIGMDPRAARLAGVNRRGLLLPCHRLRRARRRRGDLRLGERDDGGRLEHRRQLEMDAILTVVIGAPRWPAGSSTSPARRSARCSSRPRQDRRVPGDLVLGHAGVQGHRDHRPGLLQSQRVRDLFRARRRRPPRHVRRTKEAVAA